MLQTKQVLVRLVVLLSERDWKHSELLIYSLLSIQESSELLLNRISLISRDLNIISHIEA